MASFIELLFVWLGSILLNLIPFASPSNLFIASNSALLLNATDPLSLATIGFLVAAGATLAKTVHYLVTFFVSKYLKEKQRRRLEAQLPSVKRWAFLLLFVAAATPIPDEPVVIPLGLMKYSPFKFFSAFFSGKILITVLGAFLGSWTKSALSEWLNPEVTIALSIILTIIVTIVLLKVDVGSLFDRFLKRKHERTSHPTSAQRL